MSRSGSRYPSAYGHTPSYRSYVRGGLDAGPIGYSVSTPGPSTDYSKFSAFAPGNVYDLATSPSSYGSASLGRGGLGSALSTDLGGLGGGLTSAGSSAAQKVSSYQSSYSSSSRDGARPTVEWSQASDVRSSAAGPSGIPRTSVAHSSSSYSSDDPYKNRVNSYSYNI